MLIVCSEESFTRFRRISESRFTSLPRGHGSRIHKGTNLRYTMSNLVRLATHLWLDLLDNDKLLSRLHKLLRRYYGLFRGFISQLPTQWKLFLHHRLFPRVERRFARLRVWFLIRECNFGQAAVVTVLLFSIDYCFALCRRVWLSTVPKEGEWGIYNLRACSFFHYGRSVPFSGIDKIEPPWNF